MATSPDSLVNSNVSTARRINSSDDYKVMTTNRAGGETERNVCTIIHFQEFKYKEHYEGD